MVVLEDIKPVHANFFPLEAEVAIKLILAEVNASLRNNRVTVNSISFIVTLVDPRVDIEV